MAEEKPPRVRSLTRFLKWAAQFENGEYLFRGVSNDTYEIQASASRRLDKEDRNPVQLLKVNQDLIDKARLLGHDRQDGHQLSALELLAQLQHYGAATCLIDFMRNALVALWMACQQSTRRKNANGKVFAVRSDNRSQFRNVTPQRLKDEEIEFFFRKENGRFPLYQWQPKYQNNRIIAQQSVFVFGGADVPVEAECIILAGGKDGILTSLDKIWVSLKRAFIPTLTGSRACTPGISHTLRQKLLTSCNAEL
ncbi:MAG: FRG domain-containing protein [Candidatus Poribacteria bacterium]|nr:FRG domain-containing protein [Candidatus Poribacteria bacterium]MDE0504161.1 FRG domain-containing protein [Candidatus Poribacteria bacterium]